MSNAEIADFLISLSQRLADESDYEDELEEKFRKSVTYLQQWNVEKL
jgi:hypothetical protein|tara:strand:- start:467 stop:607 length:141 start_codon:yes stop_codon:yes gene_type:complete